MSIKYDPFTGEPITEDESVTELVSDVTGEATSIEADSTTFMSSAETGYTADSDPLAGKYTFQSTAVETKTTDGGYDDEMSGATSYGSPDSFKGSPLGQTPEKSMGFSETTPDYGKTVYEPMRMEEPVVIPVKPSKKVNAGLIVGLLAGLLVIAAIVLVIVFGGFFDSPKKKVAKAIKNTFTSESHLAKDLEKLDILNGDEYAITVAASVKGEGEGEVTFATDGKEKQVYGTYDIDELPSEVSEGEFAIGVDDEYLMVALNLEDTFDETFIYSYVDEKDGLLAEKVPQKTLDEFDEALKMIYESSNGNKGNKEYQKAVKEITTEYIDKLSFEKADKEKFEVDGKNVKCEGYSVTVDGEWASDFFEEILDAYDEYIGFENLTTSSYNELDIDEMKEEMAEAFDEMPELEFTFYIYKSKLAAIVVTSEEEDGNFGILFKGGDYRTQNISLVVNDDELLSIIGEDNKKKKKETFTIEADGNEVFVITYDYDDKELSFEVEDEVLIIGIETDKHGITFTLIEAPEIGDMLDLSVTITDDVKLKKLSDDDAIDLTDITERELMQLALKYPDLFGELAEEFYY